MKLSDCKEITPEEYMKLENPQFEGQTQVDENGMYWMCFSCNGVLYKTHNKL